MKNVIVTAIILIGVLGFSQNKNAKATMEVDGVCGMCKARIEKACLNTKGVKFAAWNTDNHQLELIYNDNKTDLNKITKQILAAGHDVKEQKATDAAYATVHPCCKYRDLEVRKNHKPKQDE